MTISATFRDGPLQGQVITCDIEQHTHTDRKTGAHYIRLTDASSGQPVSYFILRETAYHLPCKAAINQNAPKCSP